MDRLFVLEKEYCEDKHNLEGLMIRYAMDELCTRNLDKHICISGSEITELSKLTETEEMKHIRKIIPVGTLDFVKDFLLFTQGKPVQMKPIEIPECLWPFLYRKYKIVKGSELLRYSLDPDKVFVKDADTLKKFNSLLCLTSAQVEAAINPETYYSVSEHVSFLSEWRFFIHQDKILGMENYLGNLMYVPDMKAVSDMVKEYEKYPHPDSYVLDAGIRIVKDTRILTDNDKIHIQEENQKTVTEPIEIHPFVSAGLYGFFDNSLLDMWDKGYDWYLSADSN